MTFTSRYTEEYQQYRDELSKLPKSMWVKDEWYDDNGVLRWTYQPPIEFVGKTFELVYTEDERDDTEKCWCLKPGCQECNENWRK